MNELRVEITGPLATVIIDRPAKRNALTQQMWDELAVLARTVAEREDVRAVAFRSADPGVFSAGADIAEYRAHVGDVEWGLASQARVARALGSIRALAVPTFAVITGACVGGGAGIALACDFRLAGESAFFAITPARLGLVFPHEDIAALVDLVGATAAKRILFTGARFDASWALQNGFVDEVHPDSELEATITRWSAELDAVSPDSVRSMKSIISFVQQGVRNETAETRQLIEAALRGDDHREGVSAFLEGRPARFIG